MTEDIPETVRRLIAEHIVAIEQLEVLLLLHKERGRTWSPAQVSEEIRTSLESAGSRLRDLAGRGFLVQEKDPETYRYGPADPARDRAVGLLAGLYPERRYTIIDMIFSKPIDNLRVYADAFRFRKGESDG